MLKYKYNKLDYDNILNSGELDENNTIEKIDFDIFLKSATDIKVINNEYGSKKAISYLFGFNEKGLLLENTMKSYK